MHLEYRNKKITYYEEFVSILEDVGFMPLSTNTIGFINLSDLTESQQWHTDLPSDPWKWRVKIEQEGKGAYAKLFNKKPAFISLEWYPKFIAARRKGRSLSEMYSEGLISSYGKQIYQMFDDREILAAHEIKSLGGFTKESNSKYEAAMNELQMNMFITANGTKLKISSKGEAYGWPSAAYSTVETWAGEDIMLEANSMKPQKAIEEISLRVKDMLPNVDNKKINRFLGL